MELVAFWLHIPHGIGSHLYFAQHGFQRPRFSFSCSHLAIGNLGLSIFCQLLLAWHTLLTGAAHFTLLLACFVKLSREELHPLWSFLLKSACSLLSASFSSSCMASRLLKLLRFSVFSSFALTLQPHLLTTAFQLGLDQVRNSASLYAWVVWRS